MAAMIPMTRAIGPKREVTAMIALEGVTFSVKKMIPDPMSPRKTQDSKNSISTMVGDLRFDTHLDFLHYLQDLGLRKVIRKYCFFIRPY